MKTNSKIVLKYSGPSIYESILNFNSIEFRNQDSEPVMRYTFSDPSKISDHDYLPDKGFSLYNNKNNSNIIERVFHFHKIANLFVDSSDDKYDRNVRKGFMTATFCYIILELLRDARMPDMNFEINLINTAKVKEEGNFKYNPSVYDKLLSDSIDDEKKKLFQGFLVEKRKEDIEYYNSILERTNIDIENITLLNQFTKENLTERELRPLFESRLTEVKESAVTEPFCTPNKRTTQQEYIISNSEIVLEKGFNFYHHTESEIVTYALETRGNSRLHIDSMSELYLNEYPAPNSSGHVFMVSTNGQHRRLVFTCLGLKLIKAQTQFTIGDNTLWKYHFRENQTPMHKVIKWFASRGELEIIEQLDNNTILIKDPSQLAPWILPDSKIDSFSRIRKDILKRLRLIEKSFGSQDFKYNLIRKSCFLWYLDVHKVYLMDILREFSTKA